MLHGKREGRSHVEILPGVERVIPVMKPYKIVSRESQEEDTVIDIKGVKLGGNQIQVIAGPCSVETDKQMDADKQKIAYYTADMNPPGDCRDPFPVDRKAALAAKAQLESVATA